MSIAYLLVILFLSVGSHANWNSIHTRCSAKIESATKRMTKQPLRNKLRRMGVSEGKVYTDHPTLTYPRRKNCVTCKKSTYWTSSAIYAFKTLRKGIRCNCNLYVRNHLQANCKISGMKCSTCKVH